MHGCHLLLQLGDSFTQVHLRAMRWSNRVGFFLAYAVNAMREAANTGWRIVRSKNTSNFPLPTYARKAISVEQDGWGIVDYILSSYGFPFAASCGRPCFAESLMNLTYWLFLRKCYLRGSEKQLNENHFASKSIHCMILGGLDKWNNRHSPWLRRLTLPSGLLGRISTDEIFRW